MIFISAKFIIAAAVLLLLVVYWIFNFIILYHLTRFGVGTQPKKFAAVFLLGSVVLFFISAMFFGRLDLNFLKNRLEKLNGSMFNITIPK